MPKIGILGFAFALGLTAVAIGACSQKDDPPGPSASAGLAVTSSSSAAVSSSATGGGDVATTAPASTVASSAASSGGAGGAGGMGGAGGQGGASVSTAASSVASSTAAASGGGGGSAPASCVNGPACDAGMYCDAPGCGGEGTCIAKPGPAANDTDQDVVCGCDGATYWNARIAAQHGVSVSSIGACPGGGIACSGSKACPQGLRCNRPVADASLCSPSAEGTCWGVPISCSLAGKQGNACTDGACSSVCALVQSGHPWYDDGSCN